MSFSGGRPLAQNPYNPFTGAQVQTVSSAGGFSSSNFTQTSSGSAPFGGNNTQSLFGQGSTSGSIFGQSGQQPTFSSQPFAQSTQPLSQPFGQPVTPSLFTQSASQPFSQTTATFSSPFSQSTSQPFGQSTQPLSQPFSQQNTSSLFTQSTGPFSQSQNASIFGQSSGSMFSGGGQNGGQNGSSGLFQGMGGPQGGLPQATSAGNADLEVADEKHEPWMLEAYAAAKFQNGRIPEVPPPSSEL